MDAEIYLDANATSPVLPAAIAAAQAALQEDFGNPSSSHGAGLRARAILDAARASARRVLGAAIGRVLFTSGATEGIQTAVLSALCALRERRAAGLPCGELLLYGATEHKAVPESLAHWNRILGTGLTLQALPVDAGGRHRLDLLRELVPRTAFLCTMAANNESGVVSDLDGIAAVLEQTDSPALWMVDCVQALGKLPLQLDRTRIDYAPFSGHKLYAPKGIGLLYVRAGAPFTPLVCGGGQEAGQRSGTENMAGIAAFGAVLQALEEGGTFRSHADMLAARERLAGALRDAFPAIEFNAPFEQALPTTLNFAVPGCTSKELLDLFDAAGIRVSAGSACSAAKSAPSYVLQAMGLSDWRCANAVRLSFGPLFDAAFIDEACRRLARCGEALRQPVLSASRCGDGRAGVYQFVGDEGWLVFDPDRRECVAIDLAPGLADRVAAMMRQHGYRLRAVLGTGPDEEAVTALRAQFDVGGWPAYCDAVRMDDGAPAEAIRVGREMLVRRPGQPGYLLGSLEDGVVRQVRLAFGAAPAQVLVCAPAGIRAPAQVAHETSTLRAAQLARFFDEHPDALLIDVREACEHAAGTPMLHGRAAYNLPLSRLAEHASWLHGEARPLVFFCRSGNRSLKAVQVLQGLGVGAGQAWHLAGGLALYRAE
ncbi:aminotransferase class V-fold PLP-dependent enzyme [Massilia haematophila]|uniref:cysteine desulfurase n=1 Tax=Massilia haematophila TaxID=457923 RepID=A0ABV7PP91_9BURK